MGDLTKAGSKDNEIKSKELMSVKKDIKTIKEWANLRHPDPKVGDTAVHLYLTSNETDRGRMMTEFRDYIFAVKSGRIKPSPVKLKIPKFKL